MMKIILFSALQADADFEHCLYCSRRLDEYANNKNNAATTNHDSTNFDCFFKFTIFLASFFPSLSLQTQIVVQEIFVGVLVHLTCKSWTIQGVRFCIYRDHLDAIVVGFLAVCRQVNPFIPRLPGHLHCQKASFPSKFTTRKQINKNNYTFKYTNIITKVDQIDEVAFMIFQSKTCFIDSKHLQWGHFQNV